MFKVDDYLDMQRECGSLYPHQIDSFLMYAYHGSRAQGTATKDSDYDMIGIFVAPLHRYFGAAYKDPKWRTIKVDHPDGDVTFHEVQKFFRLLLSCNPDVISMVFAPDQCYLFKSSYWYNVTENREIFLSRRAYDSFIKYADSQLGKMMEGKLTKNLGAKRKARIEKYGFDTKNAAHLIRILRMGCEILDENSEIKVRRPDAKELIDIKEGRWSLDKIRNEAERLKKKIETEIDYSWLPEEPDVVAANRILIRLLSCFFAPQIKAHVGNYKHH